MGSSLGRVYTIARITFKEAVGSGRALIWILASAILFALMTYMIGRNGDTTVVVFTWSGVALLYLFICFVAAGGLRQQLAEKTLAPIITAPISRPEYVAGRFLGVWVPGWAMLSASFWALFTYGVVRTQGYDLFRTGERFMEEMGGLPAGMGLVEVGEMAFLLWVLLSVYLFVITAALFALSAGMGRIAALAVCCAGWHMIGWMWRWNLPDWAFGGAGSTTGAATMFGGWPSLPQPVSIGVILIAGEHARGLTAFFTLQSLAWAALFLTLAFWGYMRMDLSRPQ